MSILDLAQRIIRGTRQPSTIALVPYEEAYGEGYEDMRRRVPDNTKARELVGFDPTTTLDEIISNVRAPSEPAEGRRFLTDSPGGLSEARHQYVGGGTNRPASRSGGALLWASLSPRW